MNKKTKKQLYDRALLLEYITIVWNIFEGIVAITIGLLSNSLSIFAFGLESSIEVFSSSVVVWEIKRKGNGRKKYALRAISLALVVASIYIFINAIDSFSKNHHPDPTIIGVIAMFLITLAMLFIGSMKRKVGKKLNNQVILTESSLTLLDAGLSGSILFGLMLNIYLGWWWTDSVLAMLISINAFREGISKLIRSF